MSNNTTAPSVQIELETLNELGTMLDRLVANADQNLAALLKPADRKDSHVSQVLHIAMNEGTPAAVAYAQSHRADPDTSNEHVALAAIQVIRTDRIFRFASDEGLF